MSYDKTSDPYRSASADAPSSKMSGAGMQYLYAFQFLFEHPNWFANLLLVTLCAVIPIVGPIIFMGYQFELIEGWLARRDSPYPAFNFERFGEYLKRGVWPFLAAMLFQLLMMPLMLVIVVPLACGPPLASAIMEESGNEAAGMLCVVLGNFFIFAAWMLLNLVAMMLYTPLNLAAGLSQELGPAFNFAYLKDFVAKMWREMLWGYVFFYVVAMIFMPLGVLACFIGVYVVAAWMGMALTHLLYQFYALYIARGGMPVPLKVGS